MYSHSRTLLAVLLGWMSLMTQHILAAGESDTAGHTPFRLHVVFNNVSYKAGLESGWGFACLIETPYKTILFDTGGDGEILLANIQGMDLDPEAIDAVVLSHIHADHTGGLKAFLGRNPDVTVYMPASFPLAFQREAKNLGAAIEIVSGPRQLLGNVYSTGEMGRATKEQALIVDTREGLVVVTGCAHPNVADMAERARADLGKGIHLLMGGFHLGGSSNAEIQAIIRRLKVLGVTKVAPSHCTGDNAISMFRAAWGEDFIDGGLGAVIEVPFN